MGQVRGLCKKWRELPDGSFAWPKNKWFECEKIGMYCSQQKRPKLQ